MTNRTNRPFLLNVQHSCHEWTSGPEQPCEAMACLRSRTWQLLLWTSCETHSFGLQACVCHISFQPVANTPLEAAGADSRIAGQHAFTEGLSEGSH